MLSKAGRFRTGIFSLAISPLMFFGGNCSGEYPLGFKPGTISTSTFKIHKSVQYPGECYGSTVYGGKTVYSTWRVPCSKYPAGFCTKATRTAKPTGSFFYC